MKLQFLGAATTVTGSQFLLTTARARVVIDCGLFQGSPAESERSRVQLAYDPTTIDAILVTHAHLDHCGLLPVVAREGFGGPIYLTRASAELAELVLLDSAKVQREQARSRSRRARREARREAARERSRSGSVETLSGREDLEMSLRGQPAAIATTDLEPLYDEDDAAAAVSQFHPVEYASGLRVAPGIQATFLDAGHILGSAIIVLDVEDSDGPSRRLVFSGDLGRPHTPIIGDPTAIVDGADYVVMETTYGGREHEPEAEAVRLLADVVREVAANAGVLLIPAFAIGRTQEIVWHLDRLLSAGEIPHVPLYLDSPMASLASDIYRRYPGYYDDETYQLLASGETPLDYPDARVTTDAQHSRAIAGAARPMVIVASSGMLTGGRVVSHLRDLIDDPDALLLFVGYQGEGTLGAHLQTGARRARIDGVEREVRCGIRTISGFSAHADESELLDWVGHFARAERRPRTVFLVHGDPEALDAIEPKVRELGLPTYRPAWREEVELV
jgi:metallo-beta-lactamase family protein